MRPAPLRLALGILLLALPLLLAACGDEEVIPGTEPESTPSECAEACPQGERCCSGFCVEIFFDPAHCGGCGNVCEGTQVCDGGQCRVQECPANQSLCGNRCVFLDTEEHCGVCFRSCESNEACLDDRCQPAGNCPSGERLCAGECTPLGTDLHCSDCFDACFVGEACIDGTCTVPPTATTSADTTAGSTSESSEATESASPPSSTAAPTDSCIAPRQTCGTRCVDTERDPAHCGACASVCAPFERCEDGTCTADCPNPQNPSLLGCWTVDAWLSIESPRAARAHTAGWDIAASSGYFALRGAGPATHIGLPDLPLRAADLHSVLRDDLDRLWLGSAQGTLVFGRDGDWSTLDLSDALSAPPSPVTTLARDSDGRVWAAVGEKGVVIIDAPTLSATPTLHPLAFASLFPDVDPPAPLQAITFDGGGRAVLAGFGILHRLTGLNGPADPIVLPGSSGLERLINDALWCDGALWIASYAGVRRLSGAAWRSFDGSDDPLAESVALTLTCGGGGTVWAGLADRSDVVRFRADDALGIPGPGAGETFALHPTDEGIEILLRSIELAAPGTGFSVLGAATRWRLPPGSADWEELPLAAHTLPAGPGGRVGVLPDGTPFASNDRFSARWTGDAWERWRDEGQDAPRDIRAIASVGDALWVGSWGHGLARHATEGWERWFASSSALPADVIAALAWEPDEGLLYLAFADPFAAGPGDLWTLSLDEDGAPLPPEGGDADDLDLRRLADTDATFPLADEELRALHVDTEGRLWVGSRFEGVAVGSAPDEPGDLRTWEVLRSDSSPLLSDAIVAFVEDGEGGMWIATEGGLNHRSASGAWEGWSAADSPLPNNHLRGIAADGQGALWIATTLAFGAAPEEPGGLVRFRDGEWTVFDVEGAGLPANRMGDVATTPEGIWASIADGVIRVKPRSSTP